MWTCISQVSKIPASWPEPGSFWIPYTSPPTPTCRLVVCSDPMSVKARTESLRRTCHFFPSVWRALCESHKCCSSMAHLDGHCNRQSLIIFSLKDFPVRVNLLRIQFHLVGTGKKMFCISNVSTANSSMANKNLCSLCK